MATRSKPIIKTLAWLAVLLILFAPAGLAAQANPPVPHTPELPVRPPEGAAQPASPSAPQAAAPAGLPPLKAVLIVGPIDGDYGDWTNSEKRNMDLAASELIKNGVTVHKFYAPQNNWSQIKEKAKGAHFLMYRGHGVYWDGSSAPEVGGFSLADDFISSDQIRSDLKLAPNAIVMLYGCFTAGSSSGDSGSISLNEAKRRVAMYSDPFLDVGAAGYYADWFGDAFQLYVRYLFSGMTQRQAYEAFYDYNSSMVWRGKHPDHPEMAMYLGWDNWDPPPQYNNAFAGQPDRTLAELFVRTMEVEAGTLTYLAESTFPQRAFPVSIKIVSSESTKWSASLSPAAAWAGLSASTGASGQALNVYLTPPQANGSYATTLNITASDPLVQPRTVSIPVQIVVVDNVLLSYFPVLRR